MSRLALFFALTFTLMAAVATGTARASDVPAVSGQPAIEAQQVDLHDDTRVDVQIIVLIAAAGTVVGVGSIAYLIRRRLGRTKYDREAAEKALGQH